jgi:hypothetical protein
METGVGGDGGGSTLLGGFSGAGARALGGGGGKANSRGPYIGATGR